MSLVFNRFTFNVSCIVHIRVVLLLVLFTVWSCLQHLDEEGDEWVAASRWGWRRWVGGPCYLPLLYYSLCYYYVVTYDVLSVIVLFTASRWGWRGRPVGDPCVSSLHLHQSTGLCKYSVQSPGAHQMASILRYWSHI